MTFRYDLRLLSDKHELLAFLGVPEALFDFVVSFEPQNTPSPPVASDGIAQLSADPFFQHKIPKRSKNRGYREVWEPLIFKSQYKELGRRLNNFFEHTLPNYPHPSAYGYLGGRNIRQNATAHCGHQFLLSTDIVNFFPSISRSRIELVFLELGISEGVANPLSRFLTIGGTLPLGLPTSPVLSNAVFVTADVQLQALAEQAGATYTRYSDDLSFSSFGDLPTIESIALCLEQHGFRISEAKTKSSKRGQAHFVTGLSITDPISPHVPRDKKRRLRQELYYAQKYGLKNHLQRLGVTATAYQQNVNRLDGLVKFVSYHEARQSGRLKPQWSSILSSAGARPSYAPRRQDSIPFCICMDEAEFRDDHGVILALGMSVSQHQDELVVAAAEVLNRWRSDPWSAGNRPAIEKRGLHFADASEDLRLAFVSRMQVLPFEGYVSLGRMPSSAAYEATYLRLLGAIIKRRLMAAESQCALFVIEENSKVSSNKVEAIILHAFDELKSENNRRPATISLHFKPKPNFSISFPDFLLGVLGKYLRSQDTKLGAPILRDRLLFERLRDKYRLILDADSGFEFSRRRPIQPWTSGIRS